MEKLISCCGLDCAICDAQIATLNNDDELRKATAEEWRKAYNATDITYEMINCTGCREEGPKFSHCTVCEVRKCAKLKGFETCADCNELDTCNIISSIHKYVPEARENLNSLNNLPGFCST